MRATASEEAAGPADHPYRMKELCELVGLPRQAVHFYIQQGLVPEGHKTGKNMAYYGDAHVERIRLIRKLQHERFLPLKAIRALLDEQEDAFSPAQRELLHEVKQHLPPALHADAPETISVKEVLLRTGVDRKDLEELVALGLLATREGPRGRTVLLQSDVWILELWAQVRQAGFSRELGFAPSVLSAFEEAVSTMFTREVEIIRDRLQGLPADHLADMVGRALPLVSTFMVRYHETKVRNFFAALGATKV